MFFLTPGAEILTEPVRSRTGSDRRRFNRRRTRIWVSLPELGKGVFSRDLSVSGCCLEGDFRALKGRFLSLFLNLPDKLPAVPIQGEVMWADEVEAGVRFRNTPVAFEQRLLKHLGQTPKTEATAGRAPRQPERATFRWFAAGERLFLRLDLANWIFCYTLVEGRGEGPQKGEFVRLQVEIDEPGDDHAPKRWLLLDEQDDVVLEIRGKEVKFDKRRRSATPRPPMGKMPTFSHRLS